MNTAHNDPNWTYYSLPNPINFQSNTGPIGASFPAWATEQGANLNYPGSTNAECIATFGYSLIVATDVHIIQLKNFMAQSFYKCGGYQTIMLGK